MGRGLFTDGFNSITHFCLGLLAVHFPILIFLFLAYQILESIMLGNDPNFFIDILEFLVGMSISYGISICYKL
jgi:hypothetical protein